MDLDHVVGGLAPWEKPRAQSITKGNKRLTMSEWMRRGRSPTTRYDEEQGYMYNPKTRREKGEPELAITFDDEGSNIGALDKKTLDSAEYSETFSPKSNVISMVEYDPKRMVLRVTFIKNNDVVVYGRVPVSVYTRLFRAHESGRSVGATFWNLVRVEYRGALEMPEGQAIIQDPAHYRPKRSGFFRKGSKFSRVYQEGGRSSKPSASGPRGPRGPYGLRDATQQQLKDIQQAAQEIISQQGNPEKLISEGEERKVIGQLTNALKRKWHSQSNAGVIIRGLHDHLAAKLRDARFNATKPIKLGDVQQVISEAVNQKQTDATVYADSLSTETFSDVGYSSRRTEGGQKTKESWMQDIEKLKEQGVHSTDPRMLKAWDGYMKAKY